MLWLGHVLRRQGRLELPFVDVPHVELAAPPTVGEQTGVVREDGKDYGGARERGALASGYLMHCGVVDDDGRIGSTRRDTFAVGEPGYCHDGLGREWVAAACEPVELGWFLRGPITVYRPDIDVVVGVCGRETVAIGRERECVDRGEALARLAFDLIFQIGGLPQEYGPILRASSNPC